MGKSYIFLSGSPWALGQLRIFAKKMTNPVSFILDAHCDIQIVNYLDDLVGCYIQEEACDAYIVRYHHWTR